MKNILQLVSTFYPYLMITLTLVIILFIFFSRPFLSGKGFYLIKEKQYELAIDEFAKESIKKPQKASLFSGLGHCFKMLGNNPDSIKNYKIALELNPNLIEIYCELAILYAQEKKFDISFDLIEKGKVKNEKVSFLYKLSKSYINEAEGWIQLLSGEKEKSFKLISIAYSKLNGDLKRSHFKYSERYSPLYFRMGIVYKLQGKIEKAQEAFKQSIKSSPSSVFSKKSQEELINLENS